MASYMVVFGAVRNRGVAEFVDVGAVFVPLAAVWREAGFRSIFFVDDMLVIKGYDRVSLLRFLLVLAKEFLVSGVCELVVVAAEVGSV